MDNRDMNVGQDGNDSAKVVLNLIGGIKDNTGNDKYLKQNKGPKEGFVAAVEPGFKK